MLLLQRHLAAALAPLQPPEGEEAMDIDGGAAEPGAAAGAAGSEAQLSQLLMADWITLNVQDPGMLQEMDLLAARWAWLPLHGCLRKQGKAWSGACLECCLGRDPWAAVVQAGQPCRCGCAGCCLSVRVCSSGRALLYRLPAAPTCTPARRCCHMAPPCQLVSGAPCLTSRWRWQAVVWQQPPRPPHLAQAAPCCRAAQPPCGCVRDGRTGAAEPAAAGTCSRRERAARRQAASPPPPCLPVCSVGCRWGLPALQCSSPRPAALEPLCSAVQPLHMLHVALHICMHGQLCKPGFAKDIRAMTRAVNISRQTRGWFHTRK